MRYLVRCCCEGTKVLGFLEMPRGDYRNDEIVSIAMSPPVGPVEGPPQSLIVDPTATFRRFRDYDRGVDEIAVYSDDRPIEYWRKMRGFTEIKPVMRFTTRSLGRDMRAESEALGRHVDFHRNRGPMSMADAAALCRRAEESVSRTAAADAAAMRDQIQRLSHPSIYLALILVDRELMAHLQLARNADMPYLAPADGNPPTFLGIEIEEDPSLPRGEYEVFTDGEAAVLKLSELKRQNWSRAPGSRRPNQIYEI